MNHLVDEIECLEKEMYNSTYEIKFEIKFIISVQDIGKIGSTT
jgi:hypothetical protein